MPKTISRFATLVNPIIHLEAKPYQLRFELQSSKAHLDLPKIELFHMLLRGAPYYILFKLYQQYIRQIFITCSISVGDSRDKTWCFNICLWGRTFRERMISLKNITKRSKCEIATYAPNAPHTRFSACKWYESILVKFDKLRRGHHCVLQEFNVMILM